MLRFIVWALLAVIALTLVTVGGAATYVWHLGDKAFNEAKAVGWFEPQPSNTPMTMFESTIQNVWFENPWNRREPVCSLGSAARAVITGQRLPPAGISTALATQISLSMHHNRTLEFNLRRASLACILEDKFSDPQILRLYLRKARFDRRIAGSEVAAQTVFGKPTSELDAEESIRLAALFESPGIRDKPHEWEERAVYVREKLATSDPQPN